MAVSYGRTGRYVTQAGGHKVFVPEALPFGHPLGLDEDLIFLLSEADRALGRLDAVADMLPNPDLFVRMYSRGEALSSSQIEGVTQASLSDVLRFERVKRGRSRRPDIAEVFNYVEAMNHGIERLASLPLSTRLLREIHRELMKDVRGADKAPGQLRESQVWIGAENSTIEEATFVPPAPHMVADAMADLERYLHEDSKVPLLVKTGLAHYQFETIHPFLDGNGRMGRLLVTFYLCHQGALTRPLLYLSVYLKAHRDEYYDRLHGGRDRGDIEGWMRFFLEAVLRVSLAAASTANDILAMREYHRWVVQQAVSSVKAIELLDGLFVEPFVTIPEASRMLGVSFPTASNIVRILSDLDILAEMTGQERNREFVYFPYVELLTSGLTMEAGEP